MMRNSHNDPTRTGRRGHKEREAPFQRSDGRWCAALSTKLGRKWLYGRTRKDVADKLAAMLKDARQDKPPGVEPADLMEPQP